MTYVVNTDKGYVKGDILQGVEFVEKNKARIFTQEEMVLYFDSIIADMFDFYSCKWVKGEEIQN